MSAMVERGSRVVLSCLSIPGTENKQEITTNCEKTYSDQRHHSLAIFPSESKFVEHFVLLSFIF